MPLLVKAADPPFVARVVTTKGRVLIRNEQGKNVQNERVATSGEKLFQKDIVNTSSDGSVKLLFTDRTVIDLGPTTVFKVDEYQLNQGANRKVGVSMKYGTIRTSVNKKVKSPGKFVFKTKSATMGVRGTEFIVQGAVPDLESGGVSEPKAEAITVLSGKVSVARQASIGASRPADATSSLGSPAPTVLVAGQRMTVQSSAATASANESSASGPDGRAPAQSGDGGSKVERISSAKMDQTATETTVQDQSFQDAVVVEEGGASGGGIDDEMVKVLAANLPEEPLEVPPIEMENAVEQLLEAEEIQQGEPLRITVEFNP